MSVLQSMARLWSRCFQFAARPCGSESRPQPTAPSADQTAKTRRRKRSERLLARALKEAAEKQGQQQYYYLIYRCPKNTIPDWDRPVGGIVMQLSDLRYLKDIADERYHYCEQLEDRHEVEVRGYAKRALVIFYHKRWDREHAEWLEDAPCG